MSTHTRTTAAECITENEVVANHAIAGVAPHKITDETLAFVVPGSAELRIVDPEGTAENPTRSRGESKPHTVDALIAYCKQHDSGDTELWVGDEKISAVLNALAGPGVGWGDHRAVLTLKHSPEWEHWIRYDGKMLGQATFAEHIEDGLLDIVEPDSAEMLEIAQHFQVTRSVAFRSGRHLGSGRIGFLYDESDDAKAGKGENMEIPTEFKLGIPVYVGEEAFKITARFRYRLAEGVLTLGYKMERPDVVKQEAANQIASRLKDLDATPFAEVYQGEPGDPVTPGLLARSSCR